MLHNTVQAIQTIATKIREKSLNRKARRARARLASAFVVEPMEKRSLLSSTLGFDIQARGTGADIGKAVAVGADGSVYITGSYSGTVDFDPSAGTSNLVSAGGTDTFVAKYNSAGSLLWAKSLGGTGADDGRAIAVSSSGVYTTGLFNGVADFDPGAGTSNLNAGGKATIFVSKLDPATGNFIWAIGLGGSDEDIARAVAVDASDDVYVTGSFKASGDYDPGAGTTTLTSVDRKDIFLAKYTGSAGALVWAKSMGGTQDDIGDGLAVDSTGAYITGTFKDTADFDPNAGTTNLTSAGNTDTFVAKYSLATGALTWAARLGGTDTDEGHGIAVDATGVYTTGLFKGTSDFDPGAGTQNLTAPGAKKNMFISKLNPTTGAYVWAIGFGGSDDDTANEIALDGASVLITGSFKSTADFDPGAGTFNLTSGGNTDIFVASYRTGDGTIINADKMGGSAASVGNGIASDSVGRIYTVGVFAGTVDFDPGAGTANLTSAGGNDIFLTQFIPPTVTLGITGTPLAENGGVATVTATLSSAYSLDATINLVFSGTAVNGTDYSPSSASIFIPAGSTTGSITLTGLSDALDEAAETIIVDIGTTVHAVEVGTQQVTASITDDPADLPPDVTLGVSGSPLAENGGVATVTATLSAISGQSITVNVSFSGSATNGVDYTPSTSSIVIPAGSISGSLTLTGLSDVQFESTENIVVDISSTVNANEVGTQQVTASITDDPADAPPDVTLSVVGSPLVENGGVATVTATLSSIAGVPVSVNLAFSGTATNATDYTPSATTIVVPAGQLSASITLTGVSDLLDESNESIIVDILSVTNGNEQGTQQITATITDDPTDTPPNVTLGLTGSPLAENGGVATVTATLAQISGLPVSVNLGYSGSAVSGLDYSTSTTVIVIPAGQLTGTATLTSFSDSLNEAAETIIVDIASVTNGNEVGTQQVTATITDDPADTAPNVTLGIAGSPLIENGGAATVTATLSAISGQTVTVNLGYTGTAASGLDYIASSTFIIIAAGSLTGTVTLTGLTDTLDEAAETIIVDINSVTNGNEVGTQQVTATITDDPADLPPNVGLSITGTPLSENGGVATVTATLSAVSGQAVTVDLGFTGTAANPADYARSNTSIVIPAGSLTGSITITGTPDALDETNETVIVDIVSVTNGNENGVQQVTATITDDPTDGPPNVALSIGNGTIAENGGSTNVTATLSAISGQDVTVNLSFSGTAGNPGDYTRTGTSITIPAGSLSGSITLNAVNDVIDEVDESIVVDIASVTNGNENGVQQVATSIIDDDVTPDVTLSIVGANVAENGGAATVTATLSEVSGQDVTVNLGITGDATETADFTASSTVIVIPAGQLTGSIAITGVDDAINEATESVIVDILSVINGVEDGDQQVTATIIDDESAAGVALTLTDSPLSENGGVATVTATLSSVSGQDVTVNLVFSGTATNGDDYSASSASIVIPAGQLSASITLTGIDDLTSEANETIVVDIDSVTNGSEIGTQQVTAQITDDESQVGVTLSLANSPLAENGGAATVTATLSAVAGQDVTVDLIFTGTATEGTDYSHSATSITIPAGQLTGTITLTGLADALDEADETIVVDVTGVTNAVELGTQRVTATITDDFADIPPTVSLSLAGSPMAENAGSATVTATLSAVSGQAVTVNLGFTGTATNVTDYSRSAAFITIPAGSLTGSITLTSVSDALDEANETIIVDITSVTNGTESGSQQVTAAITDDFADVPPTVTLSLTGSPMLENGGVATVTATLSAVSGQAVTIDLGFTGTATNVADYVRSTTSIVIPAGQLTGTATITAANDALDELNETVIVDITAVTNGTETGAQQVTATIIDGSSGTPSVPDLVAASDTGVSSTDNITTQHLPTFEGTAEAGSTVKIYANGVEVGSGIATGGAYSITLASRLAAGKFNITATATDAFNNVSPHSAALPIVVGAEEDFASANILNFGGKTVAKFTDASGNTVTVSLRGPGTGKVKLPGAQGDAREIVLDGTTNKSGLTIAVKGPPGTPANTVQTTLGDLIVNGALGSVSARNTDLTGGVTATGFVGSITFDDVLPGQHLIAIGAPPDAKAGVTLKFDQVSDLTVDSIAPIKSTKATSWLSTTGDVITTTWIGSFTVTGALQAGLAASSQDAKGKSIGTVKAGDVGNIAINAAAMISTLTANTWLDGSIIATALGTVTTKGNFGADITLSSTTAARTLGTLRIGGSLVGSQIRSAGTIGSVTAGDIRNSTIFAGIAGSVTTLPTLTADFANRLASIGSLTIKGIKGQPEPTLVNSHIAAFAMGKVSLREVATGNSGNTFGLASTSVQSYKRLMSGGAPISLTKITLAKFPSGEFDRATDFVGRVIST